MGRLAKNPLAIVVWRSVGVLVHAPDSTATKRKGRYAAMYFTCRVQGGSHPPPTYPLSPLTKVEGYQGITTMFFFVDIAFCLC